MSLPQQKFREIVFQILYSWDFTAIEERDVVSFFMPLLNVTKKTVKLAFLKASSITPHLKAIDELISKHSIGYSFERISRVERNVLRLGLFELLYDTDMPDKVAISEAIRLCRKFGTRESAGYVNAVLDGIYKMESTKSSQKEGESLFVDTL